MNNISFRPVRGTEKTISSLPITDGYIYFATDSGKIYLDKGTERILVGGGVGSVIFYGNAEEKLVQNPDNLYYEFPKSYLENEDLNAEDLENKAYAIVGKLEREKRGNKRKPQVPQSNRVPLTTPTNKDKRTNSPYGGLLIK